MTGHRDAAELAKALGVTVEPGLLELALTHRSFSYENGEVPHNERLEFLGDSVVGIAVTDRLYREHPDVDEGELAKQRASLVSTAALAEAATLIDLGAFVRLGRGEELTGGRSKPSILADTFEAVMGAVYLSAGQDAASALVLRLLKPLFNDPERSGAALDPKTALQELAFACGLDAPAYRVDGEGPQHARVFTATVTVGAVQAMGEGTSKKHAEMAAALEAWTTLSSQNADGTDPSPASGV
ncbi:MAG TPA: ribonuclease III [Terrimesophilobacter sp.]|nr:ribonuclease III [Terrimesophilobacter sp.]